MDLHSLVLDGHLIEEIAIPELLKIEDLIADCLKDKYYEIIDQFTKTIAEKCMYNQQLVAQEIKECKEELKDMLRNNPNDFWSYVERVGLTDFIRTIISETEQEMEKENQDADEQAMKVQKI